MATKSAPHSQSPDASAMEKLENRLMRIMVVDDDPFILTLLSTWLEEAGYLIKTFERGEEAISTLPDFKPDLIITDLRMDGMDGITLLHEIQKYNSVLPVIMLSGSACIPDAVRATHKGVFEFLTKPVEPESLFRCVQSALQHVATGEHDQDFAPEIIHQSAIMATLLKQAQRVARSRSSVLITGATGTGKELLAQAIHRASPRATEMFLAINCGALSEQLLESELFGHEKGAFTGAVRRNPGLFQAANRGTLFLDEVGEMPPSLQVKLLRVLQEGQVKPVGATETIPIDVRIIAATNRDLEREVKLGEFREDLYYRINVIPLRMPSLAERREDISLLIDHFLARQAKRDGTDPLRFAPEAMEYLIAQDWKGNVRQLQNVIERCSVLSASPMIPLLLVQQTLHDTDTRHLQTLEEARQEFDRIYLNKILRTVGGNINEAATITGCSINELEKLIHKYALNIEQYRKVETHPDFLEGDAIRLH